MTAAQSPLSVVLWPFVFLLRGFRRLLVLLGLSSKVRIAHADKTALVGKGLSLRDALKQCPSLNGFYTPPFWLASGHLTTIAAALTDFTKVDVLTYERHYLRTADGGTIGLDWTPRFDVKPKDATPVLVCIHGLTGGSHESYVRAVLALATKQKEQGGLGWRGLVVNYRGCAGVPITSKRFYHGSATYDVRNALLYVQDLLPDAPLVGIGFSLGANVLSKYLGEEGDATPLRAAAVLSNPWDFWAGHVALQSSALGRVYSRAMASNLRRVLALHRHHFRDEDFPGLKLECVYNNPTQTLYEFDASVTRIFGGFKSAEHYYTSQSSIRYLDGLKTPLLGVNAANDPITAFSCVPFDQARTNPYLAIASTHHGGHLGWFEAFSPKKRWVAKPVLEFLSTVLESEPLSPPPRRRTKTDGQLTVDAERPEIGYRLIDASELVSSQDTLPEDKQKNVKGGLAGL